MTDKTKEASDIVKAILENIEFNTSIWHLVDTSDPSQLKKVEQRGGFLSIDAYPQIKRATEIFGPMGIGFGLSDVDYHLVEDVDSSSKNNPGRKSHMMILRCTFWYRIPGGETMGQIPVVNAMMFDAFSDTPKKLITNCITKALSYLGFNYDVFKGSWDDDPYINRPDIPCPPYMRENFKRLLNFEVDGKPFFDDAAKKSVNEFQINAGWTLQSVGNFIKKAKGRIEKAGHELPNLLTEGDSDGISSPDPGAEGEASQEKE